MTDTEQWNWLAVEIAEIRRCADVGDQAHDRLALLLIDHLVEVIVKREVNVQLAFQLPDGLVKEMQESRANGKPLNAMLDSAVDKHVGPDKRWRMDNHLHEATAYLVKKKVLTPQEREVLNRMHEYRNDAYHQDTLETGLIADLVLAYMSLASQLLARHKPIIGVPIASSDSRPIVTPGQLSVLLADGLDMDLKVMAGRFSEHAAKRVFDIAAAVAYAQALLRTTGEDPPPDDEFGRMLTNLSDVEPKLRSWAKRASSLKTKTASLVDLIIPFIGLDRALSPIEPSVRRLDVILDRWEQDQVDEIRGR
ncbi:hypothetical protein [Streptomyces sp. NPDC005148]